MEFSELEALVHAPGRTQRETFEILRTEWTDKLLALRDDNLLHALHLIRATIDESDKLRARRDSWIGSFRRDGLPGAAPLPEPSGPWADPKPPELPGTFQDALDRQLAAKPSARETLDVYRDWLEERGLVEAGRVALGPLAGADDMLYDLAWDRGFLDTCGLRYSDDRYRGRREPLDFEAALEALLDDPGPGRFLRRLTLGLAFHEDNDYRFACALLGQRPRPLLEELGIGDYTTDECELNWTQISASASLWAALPNLRSLWLRAGTLELEPIDLPKLEELEIITGGLSADALGIIASAAWPRLGKLSLQVGLKSQGATRNLDLLTPILDAHAVPKLEHLGILNCEFTDELCERLPRSRILPQLRSLDLSMGTMGEAGVEHLVAEAAKFRHLEFIDVDDNFLPDTARARLASLGPEIRFGDQRDEAEEGGRYASAFE